MLEKYLKLPQEPGPHYLSGLRGSSAALVAAELARDSFCCCIVADEEQARQLEQDLGLFATTPILHYPGHEIPPYTPLSPDQHVAATRLATLFRLKSLGKGILVTSIEALLRRVMPSQVLHESSEYLLAGEECLTEELLEHLIYLGYEKVGLVQSVGDYAVRGGIIDIYPPPFLLDSGEIHDGPLRLDFFGDTIESIRVFNPMTQRSTGTLEEVTLLPVTDILLDPQPSLRRTKASQLFLTYGETDGWQSEETARITDRTAHGQRFAGMEFFLPVFYHDQQPSSCKVMDFLPENTILLTLDQEATTQAMRLCLERIEANYDNARTTGSPALPPAAIFVGEEEFQKDCHRFSQIRCTDFIPGDQAGLAIQSNNHLLLKQDINLHRRQFGLLPSLVSQILQWQKQGDRVVICCRSPRHTRNLAELLDKSELSCQVVVAPLDLEAGPPSQLLLCDHPLSAGFSLLTERVHLLSESELFGEMRLGRKKRRRVESEGLRFTELSEGDIVVHRDHGLGIYRGLETVSLQTVINDFMLIEYRDGDKLYLPVDRLNLITRYQGLSDKEPRIDKLGTQTWKTTKAKVKEEVWKVAQELLEIYAQREIRLGQSFSTPGALFHELEESFPFDETAGQAAAINDVLQDLTSDRPMDRLVCGDVGYGKTEVAVRAAFKVVEDGYQVAILVPTTVLAEQHEKTFRERLSGFPVSISCLNRFRSPAEQRAIIGELKEGKLDIVIGTHRLLSKDVRFKKLGLLIIDEEHRFGVAHKEKLKKLKAEVDVLTLTATPIPRTLQMSLLSIRDLSVISTPPEHRQPVKTFVARYDELVIKEAVSRELRRQGQVFFVHNRVRSIGKMAALIQKLVPQARVAVAHGQMTGKQLEEIMVSFVTGQVDVLVSTTIIESGLDIPAANTIIINRADTMGLAEIYQLRGRVGRSSIQSFAYLLVPSVDTLSKDSRDRLRALMDCNELGGGFKLAMSDLQIRGGGNLLGVSQSGNIAAIGYDLYLDLLQNTVADLKARAMRAEDDLPTEEFEPEVNLQLSAYIPESYIPDIGQRYITYRKLAALTSGDEAMHQDLLAELEDRYGALPLETETLLQVVLLKKELARLLISKLEQGRDTLVFSFHKTTPVDPTALLLYIEKNARTKNGPTMKLTPDGRLVVNTRLGSAETLFAVVYDILRTLQNMRAV